LLGPAPPAWACAHAHAPIMLAAGKRKVAQRRAMGLAVGRSNHGGERGQDEALNRCLPRRIPGINGRPCHGQSPVLGVPRSVFSESRSLQLQYADVIQSWCCGSGRERGTRRTRTRARTKPCARARHTDTHIVPDQGVEGRAQGRLRGRCSC